MISTRSASINVGQDVRRDEGTEEKERAPPSPFEIGSDHEEDDELSGDEEYEVLLREK